MSQILWNLHSIVVACDNCKCKNISQILCFVYHAITVWSCRWMHHSKWDDNSFSHNLYWQKNFKYFTIFLFFSFAFWKSTCILLNIVTSYCAICQRFLYFFGVAFTLREYDMSGRMIGLGRRGSRLYKLPVAQPRLNRYPEFRQEKFIA